MKQQRARKDDGGLSRSRQRGNNRRRDETRLVWNHPIIARSPTRRFTIILYSTRFLCRLSTVVARDSDENWQLAGSGR